VEVCDRGEGANLLTKLEKNKFQHLGERKFQVVTQTTLLQIQVIRNRFWLSLTIGQPVRPKKFVCLLLHRLTLLIFDRNLILMPFPVITRILSFSISQTCGSL
jgi:hypothetical protein